MLRSVAWAWFISHLVWHNPRVQARKFRATATFWYGQVLRRRGSYYIAEMGANGRILCPPWSAMACLTAATGAHEPDEQDFIEAFIRPGDGVIDAGSSIGFYAVPLAMRGAFVSCFEPSDQTREALEANVALNQISDRIRVFPEALSDYDGEALLTKGLDVGNHLVNTKESGDDLQRTKVCRLETVYNANTDWFEAHNLAVIKVDVEGQDLQVMNGARGLFDKHRPLLMVETRLGGVETRDLLTSWGYASFWFDAAERTLIRFPDEWAGNYQFHSNIIAIASEKVDWVQTRVDGTPRRPPVIPRLLRYKLLSESQH